MRVAICDDDEYIVKELRRNVMVILDGWNIRYEISTFYTGIDLLVDVDITGVFDIIFLDIKLGQENGIDIAKRLRAKNHLFSLVLMSQYESYYKDVFEVEARWFINKPFDVKTIEKALRKIVKDIKCKNDIFEFSYNKIMYRLALREIVYIESDKRKLYIHCVDKKTYEYYAKLSDMEKILQKSNTKFARISQSYLINLFYIKIYRYEEIELFSGEKMLISQTRRECVRKSFLNRIKDIAD